jgi:ankyrin repeat protein
MAGNPRRHQRIGEVSVEACWSRLSVKLLLENGAEVNAIGGEYGNALLAALFKGNKVIMKLLLENGAEVNAIGGEYGNALQAATFRGDEAIVKLLLDNGAEVNAVGGRFGNALQAASFKGAEVIVKLLLEYGAEVNVKGGKYGNALQAASFRGTEAIVKLLLENGAEVNAMGGEYGNALQAAFFRGNKVIMKLLLVNGAEVNANGGEYGIGTNVDSASDIVDSDNLKLEHSCKPFTYVCHLLVSPQCLLGTTCWIAAEHALQHARNNITSASDVFDKWQIQKSKYVVLASLNPVLDILIRYMFLSLKKLMPPLLCCQNLEDCFPHFLLSFSQSPLHIIFLYLKMMEVFGNLMSLFILLLQKLLMVDPVQKPL